MAKANSKNNSKADEKNVTPTLSIVTQYVKDLSFEHPKADNPRPNSAQPKIDVNINVKPEDKGDNIYAVEIGLTAKATLDNDVFFNIELIYGGVFKLENWPKEQLHPLLMIECPRLLFPFARQILAQTTQTGGVLPVMLDPVDFAALYRQNLQAHAEKMKAQEESKPN